MHRLVPELCSVKSWLCHVQACMYQYAYRLQLSINQFRMLHKIIKDPPTQLVCLACHSASPAYRGNLWNKVCGIGIPQYRQYIHLLWSLCDAWRRMHASVYMQVQAQRGTTLWECIVTKCSAAAVLVSEMGESVDSSLQDWLYGLCKSCRPRMDDLIVGCYVYANFWTADGWFRCKLIMSNPS